MKFKVFTTLLLLSLIYNPTFASAGNSKKKFPSGPIGQGIGQTDIPNQVIVKVSPRIFSDVANKLSAKGKSNSKKNTNKELKYLFSATKVKRISSDLLSVKYKKTVNSDKINSLAFNGLVYKTEKDYKVNATLVPNDTVYQLGLLWGLNNSNNVDVDGPEVWDVSKGDNVVVAVIDSGISLSHKDLRNNIWINPNEIPGNGKDDDGNGYADDINGWDFYNDDNNPNDDFYHGSHCAGTIAASGNNTKGVIGVSWNAKLMALKVLGNNGSGSNSGVIEALDYIIKMKRQGVNVKVVNASFGGGAFSDTFLDKLEEANSLGIVFVAAAGNEGNDNDKVPSYPSSYQSPNVISVAALAVNGTLASFSNYGNNSVDIAAPGVNIVSTVPKNFYAPLSGTSMATPHIAGIVALIAAKYPSLNANDLKAQLMRSAKLISGLNGKMVAPGIASGLNAVNNQAGGQIIVNRD